VIFVLPTPRESAASTRLPGLYLLLACLLLIGPVMAFAEDGVSAVEVRFEGVEGDIRDNVAAAVTLNRRQPKGVTEARIHSLHRRAAEEIRKAMKVFGYYEPAIDSELRQTEDGWLANYKIEPGEPVTIEKIDISVTGAGRNHEEFVRLVEDHPFKKDEPLRHQTYTDYKNRLARRARELGYFDARYVTHTMRVDPARHRAEIILEFDTGPRYRYGPVTFSETPLREEFLRNYIPFREGDPYSSRGPLQLREELINTDMFSTVEVRPDETAGGDQEIPIEVRLEPRKPHRYTAGVGFATDTGPRLSLGWNARYLNEFGHRFNSEIQVSPVISNLGGTYLMPYFRNRPADIGVRASLKTEDTDTVDSRSGQASLFQNRTRWGWNEILSATYLVEDFEVSGERETSRLLIPGASWWKSWADDPLYAKRGGRLQLNLKGAAEPLLSDTSFIQLRLTGKYVRALGLRNRVLARLELGATGVTDFDSLPSSLRFFAGGDNSIRGYDYQSLGPEDANGNVVGGRYLIVGSIEYEQFIYKDYGAAVFIDYGNAVNDLSDPLEAGAGVGLRWLSPVGLIKLDVAAGVTREDIPIRLHISVGADL